MTLNATMTPTEAKNSRQVEFYWVIQRKYFLYEGDSECFDRNDCYKAYRRRQYDRDSLDYEMRLRIDEITSDDLDSPVVLVKEVRTGGTTDRKYTYDFQAVPKNPPLTQPTRFEFARDRDVRDTCMVDGDVLDPGDEVDYPEWCVRIICQKDSAVEVEGMDERDCRGRRRDRLERE